MNRLIKIVCFSSAFNVFNVMANTQNDSVYVSENNFERVSIQWVEPKTFTDVRSASLSSKRYRKHVFNQLEKHFDKLSQQLPDGQSLVLKVTDLDLAGRVEPASYAGISGSLDDVRVMRTVDIPRIKFVYELKDKNGLVLKTEEINLKDMNYLDGSHSLKRNRPYAHEKKMLSKWFKRNFERTTS